MIERLLSATEVCKILGISRTTLSEIATDGDIEFVEVGKRRKYTFAAVDKFIEGRTVNA
ncbi:helix-turn-helix domain-containing protein [Corynebacterium variabile]|uniref:helix-turn-helix domain-containing protein n=1 Tax=Corynebacterium variabile TaxID=1727 RepID=UPI003FD5F2C3